MKLKSFLKRLILAEEKIDRVFSPINGEILVYEDLFGKRSMRIGKVSQSGGLVVEIWEKAVNEIYNLQFKIYNCLVLGLGCGNAARLVSQKWPGAKITGIEIDPVVIEVGKKYFGMDKISNLIVIIGDALKLRSVSEKWDLVLVDLYLGQNFPKEAESGEFIEGIKKILNKDGVVIFNRFNWGKYKKQAQKFKKELEKYFPQVRTKKIVSNMLIFCQG